MVISTDGQKTNFGLSLKFEAKALKVVSYSRKNGRLWEFSEKAINLIREYKVLYFIRGYFLSHLLVQAKFPEVFTSLDRNGDGTRFQPTVGKDLTTLFEIEMVRVADLFGDSDPHRRIRDIQSWLKSKGVREFEPVSLFCDQLSKVRRLCPYQEPTDVHGQDTVAEIEKVANDFNANRTSAGIKKAIVKGIPRQAVLKPSHAIYRLQNQHFALGDRVIMVQDSGGVPLSVKGVVVGLNSKSMDVVWDVPFMSGVTLGDRFVTLCHFCTTNSHLVNLTDVPSTEDQLFPLTHA